MGIFVTRYCITKSEQLCWSEKWWCNVLHEFGVSTGFVRSLTPGHVTCHTLSIIVFRCLWSNRCVQLYWMPNVLRIWTPIATMRYLLMNAFLCKRFNCCFYFQFCITTKSNTMGQQPETASEYHLTILKCVQSIFAHLIGSELQSFVPRRFWRRFR